MNATIISCGDELVTGQCVDTNSAWLSMRLLSDGIVVHEHITVGDNIVRISQSIKRALAQSELVIITGGLGPTADDVTREAFAEAIGSCLEVSSEAGRQVTKFFERLHRAMPESNRRQMLIPRGCRVLRNEHGTAPGIGYESGSVHAFALPGVPGEMKPMFEEHIAPIICGRSGGGTMIHARLLCMGISEAVLGERLSDLMARGRNPSVGTTASHAVLSVRIVSHGTSAEEAQALLDHDIRDVRRRLGEVVFGEGEDTLQLAVANLLFAQRKTVSTAESCTGGLIAKCLTDVPGSSRYFLRGYVTYSNEAKMELLGVSEQTLATHGAVSEESAREMVAGCRTHANSDLAISMTGIAGPDGGSPEKPIGLVYIGLADKTDVQVRKVLLGDHLGREETRDRACKNVLNMLRLHLLGAASHAH
ncbi:MAG: competence/damage-inducible protein A [Planctomycetes bacterium]|nr:competence/damage-inducible protein A [Planctomycetota bacterium]MBI3834884.1 competence/damage-inducible protein A [Planctomycetota bacterium]